MQRLAVLEVEMLRVHILDALLVVLGDVLHLHFDIFEVPVLLQFGHPHGHLGQGSPLSLHFGLFVGDRP